MNQRPRSHPYEHGQWREGRVPSRSGWRRAGREGWERSRRTGGYGSQFDAWRSGTGIPQAGFGFGPDEDPGRGGFEDEDWQVTRPARGRGRWAGDWEESPDRGDVRHQFRGRGPKGYRRTDDRIYEEVCERLADDDIVDATDITVRVDNGEVTLTGTVPTRQQKWRAEECVEEVGGVNDVSNQLRVSGR